MLRALALSLLVLVPATAFLTPAGAATTTTGVLTSFDGTQIVYTLFEPTGATAATPVPIVLRTHGYASSRETAPSSTTQALLNAGYAVITWDQRGFGQSSGTVQLDSPDFEVKDAQAILDMVEARSEILKDEQGVVAAMSGGSYAGAIQLLTASFDARVRAIAPEITWTDLRYSLTPNDVVKSEWVNLFFWKGLANGAADGMLPGNPAGPQAMGYDTNLPQWYAEVMANNGPTPAVADALAFRSPSQYSPSAPALIIQGIPDSLFTMNEAVGNAQRVEKSGGEWKMVLYCGGHSGCPYTDAGQRAFLDASIVSWFDKHVKGAAVDTGPKVEWFDSANVRHGANAWPIPGTTLVPATGSATLVAQPAPLAGQVVIQASSAQPSQDRTGATSFRIPLAIAPGAQVTGIGRVSVTLPAYAGAGTEALPVLQRTLFFRLVDTTTNHVVDGQTTPLKAYQQPDISSTWGADLYGVSYVLPAGHALALEISTNDLAFSPGRAPGPFKVDVTASVPVVN